MRVALPGVVALLESTRVDGLLLVSVTVVADGVAIASCTDAVVSRFWPTAVELRDTVGAVTVKLVD